MKRGQSFSDSFCFQMFLNIFPKEQCLLLSLLVPLYLYGEHPSSKPVSLMTQLFRLPVDRAESCLVTTRKFQVLQSLHLWFQKVQRYNYYYQQREIQKFTFNLYCTFLLKQDLTNLQYQNQLNCLNHLEMWWTEYLHLQETLQPRDRNYN